MPNQGKVFSSPDLAPGVVNKQTLQQQQALANKQRPKKKEGKSYEHAFAGALAGVFSKTVMQPLDLIKTRMQVQEGRAGSHAYTGVRHAFRSIVAECGVRGLYQGLTPNLLGSSLSWGIYFYTYNLAKRALSKAVLTGDEKLSPFHHMACAGSAGVTTVFMTNPIWMIKTRIQLQQNAKLAQPGQTGYTGIINAFTRIVKEEGFFALYRGIGPALSLVSNGALQFMAYEELRRFAVRRVADQDERNLAPQTFLLMGATAKTFSSTITYPLQVVRSRLYQSDSTASPYAEIKSHEVELQHRRKGAKYDSATQVIRYVARTEGWRGFYKGLLPQLMKTAPASAITFMAYEQIMKALKFRRGAHDSK